MEIRTVHSGHGKKGIGYSARLANITWVKDLPRAGLAYPNSQNEVLMRVTAEGERLYLTYPGKESVRDPKGKRPLRPWDMYPALYLPDGRELAKLSFYAIWDILERLLAERHVNGEDAAKLATVFYRMAVMMDRSPVSLFTTTFWRPGTGTAVSPVPFQYSADYSQYNPSADVLQWFSTIWRGYGDMSAEAFLHYNDLLALQEDCKYFYGKTFQGGDWIGDTGRPNNLLTHINVIAFLRHKISVSQLIARASSSGGVSPASKQTLLDICSPYVVEA